MIFLEQKNNQEIWDFWDFRFRVEVKLLDHSTMIIVFWGYIEVYLVRGSEISSNFDMLDRVSHLHFFSRSLGILRTILPVNLNNHSGDLDGVPHYKQQQRVYVVLVVQVKEVNNEEDGEVEPQNENIHIKPKRPPFVLKSHFKAVSYRKIGCQRDHHVRK